MATATESAKTVRQALKKELGLNARAVSVRVRSGGGSINVLIHDPSADKSAVESIANRVQHYQRCEASGEILMGGNLFVFVEFSERAERAAMTLAAAKIGAIMLAAAKLEPGNVDTVEGIRIRNDNGKYDLRKDDDGCIYTSATWFNPQHPRTTARALCWIGMVA